MPHFKSIAEFEAQTGEDSPTAAETKLIAACRADEVCVISDTRPVFEPKGTTIRADLGEAAFAEAWDRGRTMTIDEAVALALGSSDQ